MAAIQGNHSATKWLTSPLGNACFAGGSKLVHITGCGLYVVVAIQALGRKQKTLVVWNTSFSGHYIHESTKEKTKH